MMTNSEFIEQIAAAVIEYAKLYDIKVHSPIIAQAILESNWGKGYKATFHNYFGLKYRKNRVACNKGYFEDGGSEQNTDGSYRELPSSTAWYAFESLNKGVKGYFEFISTTNYSNLKGITSPLEYLETLKADNYATSIDYVKNVYNVIVKNDLTRFDNKEETKVSESVLVNHTNISPNKTSPRNHKIDTITIHCVVGQLSVEKIGNIFAAASRKASSNYGIGSDGRVGQYVMEGDRSWCSSSEANDNRAITIEVASSTRSPYTVKDVVLESLINLIADICKRNDIRELKWQGNKSLIGQVDKQNMTVHRWFANKACPGDYLYNKHNYIADKVNEILNGTKQAETSGTKEDAGLYIVQSGAFKDRRNAETYLVKVRAAGFNAIKVLENGIYKIQVGAFAEKDNADAMVKKVVLAGFAAVVIIDKKASVPDKTLTEVAKEVIAGRWGNGTERKKRLESAGYKYSDVQNKVSELLG